MERYEYVVTDRDGEVQGRFDKLENANIFVNAYFNKYLIKKPRLHIERVEKEPEENE